MSGFKLQRLGMVMEPEPGNPQEIEGVLNPAAARGPDGKLYLFPRLVARGNYSRIGIARVRFNEAGDPAGVKRLGIALESEADYERRPDDSGGCEDPRITFVEPLRRYMMTYTAFSPQGPRIALAVSEDLFHWQRLGLATFARYQGIEFNDVDDKDACPSSKPRTLVNPFDIRNIRKRKWSTVWIGKWDVTMLQRWPKASDRIIAEHSVEFQSYTPKPSQFGPRRLSGNCLGESLRAR